MQADFFHSIPVPCPVRRAWGVAFFGFAGTIDFSLSADALWRFGIRKAVAPQTLRAAQPANTEGEVGQ